MVKSSDFLVFDPIQYREFGLDFYEGNGFSFRYQTKRSKFFRIVYLPFGPISKDLDSFESCMGELNSFKFSKIKIDLPLILNDQISDNLKKILSKNKYAESKYIQDEETILLTKTNVNLNSKDLRYYNRKGDAKYNVVIKDILEKDEINKIYEIYLQSSKRIGYIPKSIDVFTKIAEDCIVSLAYSKESGNLESFVFGYLSEIDARTYLNKESSTLLRILFVGSTEEARKDFIGYLAYTRLIEASFEKYNLDLIDLYGASRTKGRAYTKFKESFGGERVNLPGSFEKINFI